MRRTVLAGPVVAAAFLMCAPACYAGKLIPIPPVSGSTSMFVGGINDNNVMTGDYQTADGQSHGWVGTIDGTYTIFDAPEGRTQGRAINNEGYITVVSNPSGDNFYGDSLLRKPDGTLSPIKMSGDIVDGLPQGIIKRQQFVGDRWYIDQNENVFVYGYYGQGKKYQADLTLPFDAIQMRPRGYNAEREVVGFFRRAGEPSYGFVLKDGIATEVHYPDDRAFIVFLEGVNDSGQIAGGWQDEGLTVGNAFYYNLADHSFDVIDVPGSAWANALGINKHGITTIYSDIGVFLYCPHKKGGPAGAHAIEVRPRRISAPPARSVLCDHACLGSTYVPGAKRPADAAAVRAAFARDPELQREQRLPFRP
jgi:hypothetical protein